MKDTGHMLNGGGQDGVYFLAPLVIIFRLGKQVSYINI